jgi:hypothetical protein
MWHAVAWGGMDRYGRMDGGFAVTLSELERNTQKLIHFQENTLIPNKR